MKKTKRSYVMTQRTAKMEATRLRILDAAADLYLQAGVDEFTLEAVAALAGTPFARSCAHMVHAIGCSMRRWTS